MLPSEQTKMVTDGAILLQEGKPNQEAYMIIQGKVAVSRRSEKNQDILLAELTEGEVFGEMSLMEGSLCSATVTALGDVELQVLNKENFSHKMQSDSQTMQAVMSNLFQRIRTMNKQVVHLKDQISQLSETQHSTPTDKVVLKALTEPAKHAIYDMNTLVVDEFPYQIGRWSKKQSKTSWFSRNKVRNHISIRDIPPYVISREHCRIEKKKSDVFVTDLDSHLGTWVNGQHIGKGDEKRVQLQTGTNRICLGDKKSSFSFEILIP